MTKSEKKAGFTDRRTDLQQMLWLWGAHRSVSCLLSLDGRRQQEREGAAGVRGLARLSAKSALALVRGSCLGTGQLYLWVLEGVSACVWVLLCPAEA